MPKQTTKVSLAGKLGDKLRTAHEEHKNDETKYSNTGSLPEGIENGIAQLVDCKFGIYEEGDNKGEFFFYAAGAVKIPTEVALPDGSVLPIAGERTQISEPLCDTPNRSRKTMSEHLSWIYNELRKLGVDTKKIAPDQLETVAEALKKAMPHFKFRTWKGKPTEAYPEPRVNHEWKGLVQYSDEGGEASGVEDNTGEQAWDKDAKKEKTTETKPTKPEKASTPKAAPESTEDYEALGEAADNGDQEAMKKINGQCKLFNVDSDASPDWKSAVAELLKAMAADGGGEDATTGKEDAESAQPFKPEVSEIHFYKPVDAKTKKKVAKAVECEVTAVFEKAEKCNLKNLDDGAIYKSVPWSELEQGA